MKMIFTRKGLALRYDVSRETISKWLKEIGITHRGALRPAELERFEKHCGMPRKSQD